MRVGVDGSQWCGQRIAAGEWPSPDAYDAVPFDYARPVWFIQESAVQLRAICRRHGLLAPGAMRGEVAGEPMP